MLKYCRVASSVGADLRLTLSHMNINTQKLMMPISTAVSCSCAPYLCHKEYLVMLLKYRLWVIASNSSIEHARRIA